MVSFVRFVAGTWPGGPEWWAHFWYYGPGAIHNHLYCRAGFTLKFESCNAARILWRWYITRMGVARGMTLEQSPCTSVFVLLDVQGNRFNVIFCQPTDARGPHHWFIETVALSTAFTCFTTV
jgi:hypothetical protein